MAGTWRRTWLVAGALMIAACGGGDDAAESGSGVATSDSDTSTDADDGGADAATGDDDATADEPTGAGETEEGDGDGDDADDAAAGLGPALEAVSTFATPIPASPSGRVGSGIAVSPTGDRVAAMWIDEADFSTNLAVFDAATGGELVSTDDERLDGDLFWTSDDRLITVGNFGVLWVWDSTTLEAASDEPLSSDELPCSGGNGTAFDPVAGALFLKSDGLCRIDVTTGETVQYESGTPTTLLAVAIGGNEVYLRGTDDAGGLVLRVLDAATLDVISDEPAEGPNAVIAASANGRIEQESGGFGYLVQPAGRVVDFSTSGIETSAGGGYYVSGFDDGAVVISTSDGSTIGTIETPDGSTPPTAWSADDQVLVALTADGMSVYRLG